LTREEGMSDQTARSERASTRERKRRPIGRENP
jgi:hypothetical protein